MREKNKPVAGIGVNDSSYEVVIHAYVDGRRTISWMCPIYRAWKNMLQRCNSGKSPTYHDCEVAPEWLYFSNFWAWMKDKDYSGKDLDKDILSPGNRVYSSETCVFVSHAVNSFLIDRASMRGAYPLGVTMHAQTGKYRARCRNPFTNKAEHLGLFFSQEMAHLAWRNRKHELACIYADLESDQRIAKALRERYFSRKDAA